MDSTILQKIYDNEIYRHYLRYNPRWYIPLNADPNNFKEFEKEIKINLKMTTSDKLAKFEKQLNFVNGIVKYLNN